MSQINVDSIANTNEDGPVYFPYGMRGDASNLIYEPKVLYFDPVPLSTGISTSTNITVTFDQQIQFAGVGTIYIREGSATGTIIENFTCGVDAGASIAGETLVINPTNNLGLGTSYYVTLPAAGIANTFGAYYKGTEAYFFQTTNNIFSAEGGNYVFTVASAPSPTGYHKYHVFTATGILTTYGPSVNANDFTSVLIAGGGAGGDGPTATGGGGAGGLLRYTGPTLALAGGTYTVTIGGGGGAGSSGSNSSINSSPTVSVVTAFGGGLGGGPDNGTPGGSGGGVSAFRPAVSAGSGVLGQGNPGGTISPVAPTYPGGNAGSGGGGAGGNGDPSGGVFIPPTLAPTAPTQPTASWNVRGGNGGAGAPNPEFASPILAPRVPPIAPAGPKIGPTGLFAGGGGAGGSNQPVPSPGDGTAGAGGSGGGGHGAGVNTNLLPFMPGPFTPEMTPDQLAQPGFQNTGGGGGGFQGPPSPPANVGSGGSGIFMIRYAVPAP